LGIIADVCSAATLVDVVGSAALVTVSERSGVSLNISVDYLRPGQAGEDVLVDAKVVFPASMTLSARNGNSFRASSVIYMQISGVRNGSGNPRKLGEATESFL